VRVLHIPFCFHPDPVGGTEVYVASLAKLLREEHGIDAVIAAPGEKSCEYVHEGLRVRRFSVSQQPKDLAELYGEGDALAAQEFERILDEEKPDLVHLHAFTRGVSLRLVRAARRRGIRIFLTYHTPTVSCTRGTMMRWGSEPCAGFLDPRTCAACTLHGKGFPRFAAKALSRFRFPLFAFRFRAATALRLRSLVELRHATTRALFAEVDHIIAVCDWVRAVLLRNGVPAEKITLSRQGVADHEADGNNLNAETTSALHPQPSTLNRTTAVAISAFNSQLSTFSQSRPLRLIFLGRLDSTKGLHVLLSALRSLPSAPLTLDLFGVSQGDGGRPYEQRLRQMAKHDSRITFHPPVAAHDVVSTIASYDLLVVPSQWLETGPLVVLEAFAAGVPVMGSALGGIAELVQHDRAGWLVSPSDPRAWATAIERIVAAPELLNVARQNIARTSIRCMSDVAADMAHLYARSSVVSSLSSVITSPSSVVVVLSSVVSSP
jgi:glycosyltransferase involved in cell wall biosynthesis